MRVRALRRDVADEATGSERTRDPVRRLVRLAPQLAELRGTAGTAGTQQAQQQPKPKPRSDG